MRTNKRVTFCNMVLTRSHFVELQIALTVKRRARSGMAVLMVSPDPVRNASSGTR